MHSVLFKKTNIFCYTTFQNISRIRIQLFKTFPGYGSNFSKHFPDPDPTFQNISRIRIQLFKTFPGSGSNFSKHFPEQDPTFQSISLIRIQLFKTFPGSGSNFSKSPDPFNVHMYKKILRNDNKRPVLSSFCLILKKKHWAKQVKNWIRHTA